MINLTNNEMKKLSILLIAAILSVSNLYSQSKTIKGRVILEDFRTMPEVSLMINDTVEVGKTDFDGFFQLDIPISKKEVVFDFIGVESVTIYLEDNCDNLEVIMMSLYSYDFISLKQAEKKRKKRYKKLDKLHKLAFEKGLFETDCPCYRREFESLYLSD